MFSAPGPMLVGWLRQWNEMDEYNSGMDPEVKKYFRQIVNSFSVGVLWLVVMSMLGIYFRLGLIRAGVTWYNIVFYLLLLCTLAAMLYYFYRVWGKSDQKS